MSNAYLRFWGVRGSHASPFSSHLNVGGNTSCVEIRQDDHLLVCDAGTGIIPLGNELLRQNDIREMMIVLTHYHWDHVCGLPFFVPAFTPQWHISFFGPGDDVEEIKQFISAPMQAPYFPVGTESWLANIKYLSPQSRAFNYGPFSIKYSNVHHPGTTYGYRILVNGKSLIYISDNECMFIEKSVHKSLSQLNEEEQALYHDMIREKHQEELELIKDADILIHDAQYTAEDYEKKRGWGHSCYIDTINMAIEANVKELYLYHHDPHYDDRAISNIHEDALKIIKQRKSSMQCHIAREGLRVEF